MGAEARYKRYPATLSLLQKRKWWLGYQSPRPINNRLERPSNRRSMGVPHLLRRGSEVCKWDVPEV